MNRLSKFSDRDLALMLGALNLGRDDMKTLLICEASYRLVRAGGAGLSQQESELIDAIMTAEYRLRENRRQKRRLSKSGRISAVSKAGRRSGDTPPARIVSIS